MSERKILIPIDEPDFAKKIVKNTLNIIGHENLELTLLNVNEANPIEEEIFYKNPDEYLGHEARKSEFALVEDYLEQKKINYKFISREGDAVREILREQSNNHYDLISLGAHGKSNLEKLLLGSVNYKVSRSCKSSVLVIKRDTDVADDKDFNVIFAADNTESTKKAAANLPNFVAKGRSHINLLHVIPPIYEIIPPDSYVYTDVDKILEESKIVADEFMAEINKQLVADGCNVTKRYSSMGHISDTVIKEAESLDAGVIILGAHSRNKIQDFIIGSVSARVYEYATRAVLLLK